MNRRVAFALATLLIAAPLAAEQDGSVIEPGTRVRLTSCYSTLATACLKSAGTLSSWRSDSVLMKPEGRATAVGVPRAWVTHIEVSRGRKHSVGKGAVIGFVPGLVMLAATTLSPNTVFGGGVGGCHRDCVMTVSLGVSIFGAALGAFIGSGVQTEQWQDLPLPPPL